MLMETKFPHSDALFLHSLLPLVKHFKVVSQEGRHNLYLIADMDFNDGIFANKGRCEIVNDDTLPEEKIDITYLFYKSNLKKQILDHILECHPRFFEQLVINLLLEMGMVLMNRQDMHSESHMMVG